MSETEELPETGEQEQEQEQQSDETTQFNDPNSDYWKEIAIGKGWQEDFEGNQEKFKKTPREYVNDGKFLDQLHSLRNNQERMQGEFEQNTQTQLSMQKAAHQAQIDELKVKRDDAIEDANREVANQYQQKIDDLKESMSPPFPAGAAPYEPGKDPAVRAYEERNPWLKDINDPRAPNYAKAKFADDVFTKVLMRGGGSQEALRLMDQAVRQSFPQNNPNRQRAPNSEGSQRPAGKKAQDLPYEQLSRQEQNDIDKAVRFGAFTKAEAVKKINGYRREVK